MEMNQLNTLILEDSNTKCTGACAQAVSQRTMSYFTFLLSCCTEPSREQWDLEALLLPEEAARPMLPNILAVNIIIIGDVGMLIP